jgi:hypothetical protein
MFYVYSQLSPLETCDMLMYKLVYLHVSVDFASFGC